MCSVRGAVQIEIYLSSLSIYEIFETFVKGTSDASLGILKQIISNSLKIYFCILLSFLSLRLVFPCSSCAQNSVQLSCPRIEMSGSIVHEAPCAWLRQLIFRLIVFYSIWLVSVIRSHWSEAKFIGKLFQYIVLSLGISIYFSVIFPVDQVQTLIVHNFD